MKTIVIQATLGSSAVRKQTMDWEKTTNLSVIEDCINSVKNWANVNNFDYVHYTDKDSPGWNLFSRNDLDRASEKLYFINQPNYDRVVWLDNDVLIVGNPKIDDSVFSIHEHDEITRSYARMWINSGVMIGQRDFMTELSRYAENQQNKNTRDDVIEFQRMCNILGHEPLLLPDTCGFYEEVLIQEFIKNKSLTVNRLQNYIQLGLQPFPIDYNFFLHFEGAYKEFKYEMFKLIRKTKDQNYFNTMIQNMLLFRTYLDEEPRLQPHEKRIK